MLDWIGNRRGRFIAGLVVAWLAAAAPASAITAFANWNGGSGIWSNPVQWAIGCPQVPPPTTPGNTASCLFTVNVSGPASDVQGDVGATISVLNLNSGAELSIATSLTSLIDTSIGSQSTLTVGPVASLVTGLLTNQGTLDLGLLAGVTAVTVVNGGTIDSTGGSLLVGSIENLSGATIDIGPGLTTLSTAVLVNEGTVNLSDPASTLSASLSFFEFSGSGEVVLAHDTASLSALVNLGNLGGHTIRGTGSVVSSTMVNQGDVLADSAGDTLHVITGFLDSTGDLRALGGTLDVDAVDVVTSGTVEATGATGKWKFDATNLDNDGLMVVRSGARGEIKNASVDNGGGILQADGGSIALEDVGIEGGVITSNSGGFVTMAGSGAIRDLTNSADFRFLPGSVTSMIGTITNDGVMTVPDGAAVPGAGFFVTLDGTGRLVLAGDNATFGSTTTTTWTQGAAHTIEGFGTFQGLVIDNGNRIVANVAGQRLRVTAPDGGTGPRLINRGSLEAIQGGILRVENSDIDNTSAVVLADTGSIVELDQVRLRGGSLTGAGEIQWSGLGALLDGTDGSRVQGTVNQSLLSGSQVAFSGFDNDGTIMVGDGAIAFTTGVAHFTGAGSFSLDGPGAIFGSAGTSQYGQSATHRMDGEGLIQGFGFHNEGTLSADRAGKTLNYQVSNGTASASTQNDGLFEATGGGTLAIQSARIDNFGTIRADANSLVTVANSEIRGGTLEGAGEVQWTGNSALREAPDGSRVQSTVDQSVLAGSQVLFEGFDNEGTVSVEDGAIAFTSGVAHFVGTGSFSLEGPGSTFGSGLTSQYRQSAAHRIGGEGLVQGFAFHNEGTLSADRAGRTLSYQVSNGTAGASTQNDGLFEATGGGTLAIQSARIDNIGTIRADASSLVTFRDTAVRGGILDGVSEMQWFGSSRLVESALDGSAVQSLVDQRLRTGTSLFVTKLQNDATITIEDGASLLPGSQIDPVSGSGEIVLDGPGALLGVSGASHWTQGANHEIRGEGRVEGHSLASAGTIAADRAGRTLHLTVPNLTNTGTVRATNGGTLDATAVFYNDGGVIEADTGSVIRMDASAVYGGLLTGAGEIQFLSTGLIAAAVGGSGVTNESTLRIIGPNVRVSDTLTNDGHILVEDGALLNPDSNGFPRTLIAGGGTVSLLAAGSQAGSGLGLWTNGPGHTVEGVGTIGASGFQNNGVLSPGLAGGDETAALRIAANAVGFGGTSHLDIQLGGSQAGVSHDFIQADTTLLDLGGVLALSFVDGFAQSAQASDVLTILTALSPLTQSFSNVSNGGRLDSIDGRGSFLVHYGAGSVFDAASVVLSDFVALPEPGTIALLTILVLVVRRRQAAS